MPRFELNLDEIKFNLNKSINEKINETHNDL